MRVEVAVATSNPMKVRAVERVFKRFFDPLVKPVRVDHGVPSQPVGRQVYEGAYKRAILALETTGADFGVGIEAGPIIIDPVGYLEGQIAVVASREGIGVGVSPLFMLPSSIMDMVVSGVELSNAFKHGRSHDIGESIGVIGIVTQGAVTRQDLTEAALTMALLPFIAGSYGYKPVRDK